MSDSDDQAYTDFDATKLQRIGKAPADAISVVSGAVEVGPFMPFFVDGSDSYANKGMAVSFHHVPSEENIYFKAFISAFKFALNSKSADSNTGTT